MRARDNTLVTTQHVELPDTATVKPPHGRPMAFLSWGSVAGRSAEIADELGGDARCFFPHGSARRPPVLLRYAICAVGTAWYLWRRKPRLVVVTNPPVLAAWFVSACARLLGAAVVIDSHPGGFGAQGDRVAARLQWLHRRLVRRAAGVLVTDEQWCERVREWGGIAIVVHESPGSVDGPPPTPGPRFRVLVVGNFNRDEPTSAVLDTARQLPDCEFVVTGELSKCAPELMETAPPNVQLVGFLDPTSYRAALTRCNAVMTLTTEPTSVMRAAYEAVYARRPVILSDWPVARALFPYAVHAANEPFDLAAAVSKLRSDYPHFCTLVDVAHAEQIARWHGQLRSLTSLVDSALSSSATSRRRGSPVLLHDLSAHQAVAHIVSSAASGRGGRVANVNVDNLRKALRSSQLRQQINDCDLVLADGAPIVWATRLEGSPVAERVPASEIIWPLCEAAARTTVGVFLLGGSPSTARRSAVRLARQTPGLRVDHLCPPHGFQRSRSEMSMIFQALKAAKPGIVFCAFGAPKQEEVMETLARQFPTVWFVACGGTFEMVCGDLPQAPRWMRKSGLEWLHRLALEPRRLFGRYIVCDLPFAAKLFIVTAVFRRRRPDRLPLRVCPPPRHNDPITSSGTTQPEPCRAAGSSAGKAR